MIEMRLLGAVMALLSLSCASGPARYAQTDSATNGCFRNPTCYTQPGDEAFLPWVDKAARATATAGAALKVLEAADVARIEHLLVECAKEANRVVNEREYGEGKYPDDKECKRVIGRNKKGEPLTRQMELGTLKHAVAFACVRREVLKHFPDQVSIEPRFGPDPTSGKYALTNQWEGSMKPDIVLHASGQPNQVQCIYDFKFPCTLWSKEHPLDAVHEQLRGYTRLGGNCKPAIVTPLLGVSRE
ncbi:hypothetical protein [Corallococcus exercitus]|uniref:Lipoprotein n=1 Tax=Corallococcus exercitus TaxID=2316736 RepID=A0A7Y4NBS9_9BACT|nr:hypothetical protein [Corallococcus exercitus]NOK07676.1 hypothetical protein [Corallococcus exercitus]